MIAKPSTLNKSRELYFNVFFFINELSPKIDFIFSSRVYVISFLSIIHILMVIMLLLIAFITTSTLLKLVVTFGVIIDLLLKSS